MNSNYVINRAAGKLQTLYLIKSGSYLKIGITQDIGKRMREYSAHNPDFEVISLREGNRLDETFLHRLLSKFLVGKNEWMCYSQEIVNTFKNVDLEHTGDYKSQPEPPSKIVNVKNYGKNNGMYGIIPANSKSVLQYTLDGEFVQEYPSIAAAKRATGIDNISYACNGKRPSAGGFLWRKGDNDYSNHGRSVCQFSVDGSLVKEYCSAWEAAKQNTGFDASSIHKVCRNGRGTHKGFMWRFKDDE